VIAAIRTAFPDIHLMMAEEDKVFSRLTWHGTIAAKGVWLSIALLPAK